VCRWECEEVEEKVPGWDCECEDIVIPGKSPFCIKDDCEECCDDCCHRGAHFGGRLHHKKVWGPPCGCCVKTVKVLVRKEKTVKKLVYKPVIETVCDNCCNACGATGACASGAPMGPMDGGAAPTMAPEGEAPMAPIPPPPVPDRQTSRRGINPFLSALLPASRQR
jgi:hypothetical protein